MVGECDEKVLRWVLGLGREVLEGDGIRQAFEDEMLEKVIAD